MVSGGFSRVVAEGKGITPGKVFWAVSTLLELPSLSFAILGLLMPLFTFNLGVEIGQVAIAAVVLPIIWQLRKNEKFVRRGVPALSVIVALAGLYWLLERTVFA